jgi:hypothetical protein
VADQTTFEARLSNALDQYADRVPDGVDISAVVQAATLAPRRSLAAGLAPSRLPIWLRVGAVAALLAVAGLVAYAIGQQRDPLGGGGRLIVSVQDTGWIFDPSLGEPVKIAVGSGCASNLVDGGNKVVTGQRFGPVRIRPIDGDLTTSIRLLDRLAIPGYGGTNSERWSPDGTRFALMRFGGQPNVDAPDGMGAIMVISIHGVDEPVQTIFEVAGPAGFAWSADSRHLAVIDLEAGRATLIDIDLVQGTQRAVAAFDVGPQEYPLIAWTAGGTKVAITVDTDGGARPALVDVASGAIAVLPMTGSLFGWSPDGSRAIDLTSETGPVLLAADGSARHALPSGELLGDGWGPTPWSADSRFLSLSNAGRVTVVDRDGRVVGEIPLGTEAAPLVAWSPEGHLLAVATVEMNEGVTVGLYDAANLELVASALVPSPGPMGPANVCFQWASPID